MKKIFVSTVCFLVVLISCRQQEDVSLSQEDLVNIKLIQKNRNYRKINNITNIKTDTVYRTQTLDMGTGELDVCMCLWVIVLFGILAALTEH
jgi:uncharacterized protein YerC